jgi:hypothetical protein
MLPTERSLLAFDLKSLNEGKIVEALVLTKDPSWCYEREWRSLAPNSGKRSFTRRALVGIIFGCEIPLIDEMCVRRNIPPGGRIKLYRAKKREEEFGLDIIEEI